MLIFLRGTAVLLLSFLAATSPWAQSPCNIRLSVGQEGNVTAKRGDTVSICLPLTSGTGYSWQLQTGGDAMTLQPASAFERDGQQPGASGTMRFTMRPATPGDYTLVFMLVPPGNTGAEAGRVFVGLKIL